MLKLLLNKENKEIKREYAIRFAILFLFGLSGVLFLFLISLIPAYFLLKVDQKVLTQELSVAQDSGLNADRKRLKEKLSSLQQTLNIVDTPNNDISYYIQKITERQPRDINILSINIENKSEKRFIVMQGVANSRSGLSSFVKTLEDVTEFESVVLPFSSFTKETEIPFSVTINLVSNVEKS
ncbi:MAG: hypothetical protein KBD10_01165 [Candidatus Pacebacteria bacterium]|nr:hypothetical protein [Candidatus Paceibacterota bacterium]